MEINEDQEISALIFNRTGIEIHPDNVKKEKINMIKIFRKAMIALGYDNYAEMTNEQIWDRIKATARRTAQSRKIK